MILFIPVSIYLNFSHGNKCRFESFKDKDIRLQQKYFLKKIWPAPFYFKNIAEKK